MPSVEVLLADTERQPRTALDDICVNILRVRGAAGKYKSCDSCKGRIDDDAPEFTLCARGTSEGDESQNQVLLELTTRYSYITCCDCNNLRIPASASTATHSTGQLPSHGSAGPTDNSTDGPLSGGSTGRERPSTASTGTDHQGPAPHLAAQQPARAHTPSLASASEPQRTAPQPLGTSQQQAGCGAAAAAAAAAAGPTGAGAVPTADADIMIGEPVCPVHLRAVYRLSACDGALQLTKAFVLHCPDCGCVSPELGSYHAVQQYVQQHLSSVASSTSGLPGTHGRLCRAVLFGAYTIPEAPISRPLNTVDEAIEQIMARCAVAIAVHIVTLTRAAAGVQLYPRRWPGKLPASTSGTPAPSQLPLQQQQQQQLPPHLLLQWRPWAAALLSSNEGLQYAANYVRPSLDSPAEDPSASLLDMVLAPPFPGAEGTQHAGAGRAKLAALLLRQLRWMKHNRQSRGTPQRRSGQQQQQRAQLLQEARLGDAATAAEGSAGSTVPPAKQPPALEALAALLRDDPVFGELPLAQRIPAFLEQTQVGSAQDVAAATTTSSMVDFSHVAACGCCGRNSKKLGTLGLYSGLRKCSYCVMAVCEPCCKALETSIAAERSAGLLPAAVDVQLTATAATATAAAAAAAAAAAGPDPGVVDEAAADEWPYGLCPWCLGHPNAADMETGEMSQFTRGHSRRLVAQRRSQQQQQQQQQQLQQQPPVQPKSHLRQQQQQHQQQQQQRRRSLRGAGYHQDQDLQQPSNSSKAPEHSLLSPAHHLSAAAAAGSGGGLHTAAFCNEAEAAAAAEHADAAAAGDGCDDEGDPFACSPAGTAAAGPFRGHLSDDQLAACQQLLPAMSEAQKRALLSTNSRQPWRVLGPSCVAGLPNGYIVIEVVRRSNDRVDRTFVSPVGNRLRSLPEVDAHHRGLLEFSAAQLGGGAAPAQVGLTAAAAAAAAGAKAAAGPCRGVPSEQPSAAVFMPGSSQQQQPQTPSDQMQLAAATGPGAATDSATEADDTAAAAAAAAAGGLGAVDAAAADAVGSGAEAQMLSPLAPTAAPRTRAAAAAAEGGGVPAASPDPSTSLGGSQHGGTAHHAAPVLPPMKVTRASKRTHPQATPAGTEAHAVGAAAAAAKQHSAAAVEALRAKKQRAGSGAGVFAAAGTTSTGVATISPTPQQQQQVLAPGPGQGDAVAVNDVMAVPDVCRHRPSPPAAPVTHMGSAGTAQLLGLLSEPQDPLQLQQSAGAVSGQQVAQTAQQFVVQSNSGGLHDGSSEGDSVPFPLPQDYVLPDVSDLTSLPCRLLVALTLLQLYHDLGPGVMCPGQQQSEVLRQLQGLCQQLLGPQGDKEEWCQELQLQYTFLQLGVAQRDLQDMREGLQGVLGLVDSSAAGACQPAALSGTGADLPLLPDVRDLTDRGLRLKVANSLLQLYGKLCQHLGSQQQQRQLLTQLKAVCAALREPQVRCAEWQQLLLVWYRLLAAWVEQRDLHGVWQALQQLLAVGDVAQHEPGQACQ